MDERRNRGDHHQHHCGQRVDAQRPVKRQRARLHPLEHRHDMRLGATAQKFQKDRPAQCTGCEQRTGGERFGDSIAKRAVAKPGDDRSQQRQENDEQDWVHLA